MKESFPGTQQNDPFTSLSKLVGNKSPGSLRRVVKNLKQAIAEAPVTGRAMEARSGAHEFVIPYYSEGDKEYLLEILFDLGIFPWEDNRQLIIERPNDLEKLRLAGIIVSTDSEGVVVPEEEVLRNEPPPPAPLPPKDEYAFTIAPSPTDAVFPKPSVNRPWERKLEPEDSLEPGIDTELQGVIDRFDQGLLDEHDSEFVAAVGSVPNLSLFKQKYYWQNGRRYNKATGEEVTREKEQFLIEAAQKGDQKAMQQIVEMTVGLVLYKLAQVRKRFGTAVEADDLFQVGLMGVKRAVERYSNGEDKAGNFAALAVAHIEGNMRRLIAESAPLIRRPEKVRQQRRAYFKALNRTRALHPELPQDDPVFIDAFQNELYQEGIPVHPNDVRDFLGFNNTIVPEGEAEIADETVVTLRGQDTSDILPQEKEVFRTLLKEKMTEVLQTLTPRESLVLMARFGFIPKNGYPEWYRIFRESVLAHPERYQKSTVDLLKRIDSGEDLNLTQNELVDLPFEAKLLCALGGKFDHEYDVEGTLDQIGALLNISRERVRSIEAKALRKLRHPARSRKLRSFLDD